MADEDSQGEQKKGSKVVSSKQVSFSKEKKKKGNLLIIFKASFSCLPSHKAVDSCSEKCMRGAING